MNLRRLRCGNGRRPYTSDGATAHPAAVIVRASGRSSTPQRIRGVRPMPQFAVRKYWIARFHAGNDAVDEGSQYVDRPPDKSNTAPVENEHSSLASQATSAAISAVSPKRPIGIFDSM
jgi:hypothetical protein